ncbi:fruit bromelain-like [Diaphorina citri]|uniref:Fruit bromelain-like n=1 Tax=Diaphorina citri TaxID=121845 RepID=A0A3Q0ISQ6_DIACI|nr:fruit bromelain-like [Diaphorina citri]
MISIKTVLVALCVSLGVSRGDVLSDVDRVLENLILQRSQPNSYGSEEASTFDLEEFLDHGNQFKDFVREYERQYDSDSEIERRFDIFRNNLKTIDYYTKHEQGTATYGVNRFADMTDSEFNHGLSSLDWEQIENLKSTFETYSFNSSNSYGLAESINYKDKGKVLPKVQDQHLCGSCWAHSAVACLESAYAIKHNELIELSKQRKKMGKMYSILGVALFYKGGVMNLPHMLCSKGPYSLNHAVLNVGYDNESKFLI